MPITPAEIDTKAQAKRDAHAKFPCKLYCCASTGCISSGSKSIQQTLAESAKAAGIGDKVEIIPTGCMGLCSLGPLVRMEVTGRKPILFKEITQENSPALIAEAVVPALAGAEPKLAVLAQKTLSLDLPFFTKQVRVVLENSGQVNPESLDDYLAHDGYLAIRKALTSMSPQQVIDEVRTSGLRGRGGAGFPTAIKWEIASKQQSDVKYIICNGDEGDPGAYMDRSVLEGDPHAVLEGMLLGAYAMGCTHGVFYIRAEYPLAVERIERALKEARKAGLLGKNIMGTPFSFDCEVRLGAGAFVCGEETALIASVEGRRGTPRPRPPFPAVKGLWDKPTVINNVETLANVVRILRKGGAWFASMGTEKSKGTKVFALTGKIAHNGLVEVPMGITLRDIVVGIGGGTGTGKEVKAVQTGGPSGGLIPASRLDTPVSYEHLQQLGSIMGSGGMIVMDEDDSVVDLTRFYLDFTVDESCGKCAPCRIGGRQLLTLLDRICEGKGSEEDLVLASTVAVAMQKASLCGLGQTAPNPVLSALRYFNGEFKARLAKKPGAVCANGCTH